MRSWLRIDTPGEGSRTCDDMPVTVPNSLDAALAAAQSGARVILLEPEVGDAANQEALLARVAVRDYSGRGPDLYRALLEAGAKVAASPTQALDLLTGVESRSS